MGSRMSPETLPASPGLDPGTRDRGTHSGQPGAMAGSGPVRLFRYKYRNVSKLKADAFRYAAGMRPVRRLVERSRVCMLVRAAYSGGNVPAYLKSA